MSGLKDNSNQASAPFISQSIASVFENTVLKYGDHLAIKDGETFLTYQQLNSYANRMAREILSISPVTGQPIGLFFRNKPLYLAALLGVLKTGNIALPIDPEFPDSHNIFIAKDAYARIFLADNETVKPARQLYPNDSCYNMQELHSNESEENVNCSVPSDGKAVILYTSGSTGKPKGVIHTHKSLLHNAFRQKEFLQLGSGDRMSMLYPSSVMGMLRGNMNAITSGAALLPFDIRTLGIAAFLDWVEQQKLTVLHTIPSLFHQLGEFIPRPEQLQSVRLIILGGEAVSNNDVEIYKEFFPDSCRIFTGLGSTETGTTRQNILDKTIILGKEPIPIGYPVRDVEILLQDENGDPVAPGEIGEIVVQSPYMAVGYWQRPELNKAVFLPDPQGGENRIFRTGDLGRFLPDGCLVHCGRRDHQVKIRGYRVEPQEVESVLLGTGLIKDTVVISHTFKDKENRLVAYVIPQVKFEDLAGVLRQAVRDRLPDYKIPSYFIRLKSFPRTPNGKIDRQALPNPRWEDLMPRDYTAPRTNTEKILAKIWMEVLEQSRVGMNDDFFEIGGNSLNAMQVATRIQQDLNIFIPIHAIFKDSNLSDMAAKLDLELAQQSTIQNVNDKSVRRKIII